MTLFLVGVCVAEQIVLVNYLTTMQEKVSILVDDVKNLENVNTPEIIEKVNQLEKTWNGYETVLCFVVNLKDIEDVGIELTKTKVFVEENNIEDLKKSLSLILYHLEGYYNFMGISFENIF